MRALGAIALATAIWLPSLHFFHRGAPPHELARGIAAAELRLWTDPALRAREIRRMRASNAEWDFMARSFLAWALANRALAEPATRRRALAAIDAIVDETLRLERERGQTHFLLPYGRARPFVDGARSQFVDGEIALMIALRRLVEERRDWAPLLTERVDAMAARMLRGPVLSAESYPDECWTFCNTVALAAIRAADVLDGSDHAELLASWVRTAKRRLVHRPSGLLVSSYSRAGRALDGPEGSSIWLAAHMLDVVDPAFARDQYRRAKREIAHHALGFAWAGEWPRSWHGHDDVDSGPTWPLLDLSASSSGFALLGATAFRDAAYRDGLLSSLDLGGFPMRDGEAVRFAASNAVGDAVALYALSAGPAWRRLR